MFSDRISTRGANRRADTARALIGSILARHGPWVVSTNPASGLRNRHDYQPRDVVASEDDLRRLLAAWNGHAPMSPSVVTIVRLALLTGLSCTKIAGARKAELELSTASPVLTIPRGRADPQRAPRPLGSSSCSVVS